MASALRDADGFITSRLPAAAFMWMVRLRSPRGIRMGREGSGVTRSEVWAPWVQVGRASSCFHEFENSSATSLGEVHCAQAMQPRQSQPDTILPVCQNRKEGTTLLRIRVEQGKGRGLESG